MEYEKETCINDGKCWFQNKQTSGEWDIPDTHPPGAACMDMMMMK